MRANKKQLASIVAAITAVAYGVYYVQSGSDDDSAAA
jgi:hypothetical protein